MKEKYGSAINRVISYYFFTRDLPIPSLAALLMNEKQTATIMVLQYNRKPFKRASEAHKFVAFIKYVIVVVVVVVVAIIIVIVVV